MKSVDNGHPPGMVGVVSSDVVRCIPFVWSLMNLETPTGSMWTWQVSAYVHENRNKCVSSMLDNPKLEWLFFVDDDNTFDKDHLTRLLAHNVDIVGSFYVKKGFPYIPHLYHFPPGKTEAPYENYKLEDIPDDTLFEVDALATSGLLVRRKVFEESSMRNHPFEFLNHMGEDMAFCYKAQKLGYKIYVDTGAVMEHWGVSPVRPGFSEDRKERVILMRQGSADLEIG